MPGLNPTNKKFPEFGSNFCFVFHYMNLTIMISLQGMADESLFFLNRWMGLFVEKLDRLTSSITAQ